MTARMVAACCLLLAACQNPADDAKAKFSSTNTCPLDRVEVRNREDIDLYDLEHGAYGGLSKSPPTKAQQFTFQKKQPPANIAADPGRLEMWNKQQADQVKQDREYLKNKRRPIEVRGCGLTILYKCELPGRKYVPGIPLTCDAEPWTYPPGSPPW